MTKKDFLTSFFLTLDSEDIDYFVYGEYRSLPKDTGESDIDIIVSDRDKVRVEDIMKTIIVNCELDLVSFYANTNAKFYRYLSSCGWGVQIDVLEGGLFYRGIAYYPYIDLSRFVTIYNGIKVLDINKGFYIDYIKEIIHNGRAKEKYRNVFLEQLRNNNDECKSEIEQRYSEDAWNLIKVNDSIDGLNHIGKELQKIIKKKLFKGNILKLIKSQIFVARRLFQKRPGYVICILGTDGSGKSTIIDAITLILNEGFHNGVVYNHLRPNLIPDLGILLGKKEKQEVEVVNSDPHSLMPSGFLGSIIRWGYYMIDYTVGYFKNVWSVIHTKSKVFIFDRYYYDYYIDQLRTRTSLPQWILKIGELFVPQPDLILCLGGDSEKIYKRKPETSLEEVDRQNKVLKRFCDNRKDAVWIDTTTTKEESINASYLAILDMMKKRFN